MLGAAPAARDRPCKRGSVASPVAPCHRIGWLGRIISDSRILSDKGEETMIPIRTAGAAAALAIIAAATPPGRADAAQNQVIEMPDGLKYTDTKLGDGAAAAAGDKVSVHYTGWLSKDGAKGAKFDSSRDRGRPFDFTLGAHQVIAGWDEGVAGMKVGGERTLTIPPELGYGAGGAGAVIPPNATLIFDVELLKVQ
jgi:FKBP-type peptidyl-prolyl cis-trans isomerase